MMESEHKITSTGTGPQKLDEKKRTGHGKPGVSGPWHVMAAYLTENSPELRQLNALRKRGWENPESDQFFQRQRKNADHSSAKNAKFFYGLMQKIGDELQKAVFAFTMASSDDYEPWILDTCMAPGGFLKMALKHNSKAKAVALSLPEKDGGHKCLLPNNSSVEKHFVDITMLAADIRIATIPPDHPEVNKFLPRLLPTEKIFDLMLCDGQVLRNHELAPYREKSEARRLTASQLVLGLERLRPGGTIIFLMHKVEAWNSIQTLYAFSQFAKVILYKPTIGHAKRSSFYLIAKNVQSESQEALSAIEWWRQIWRAATFPARDGSEEQVWQEDRWTAEEIIESFGPELLKIAAPIWKEQAKALANTSFIKGSTG
ncbi:uncharacterized protein PgNI_02598 [Pyricularia grisea]|uniref:Ribosomal RNA methyltransferase FtsJ domain-containing protein n=1 Tax=Pyricularia grisea TaxID=148305 RepID=A0A6P8BHE2_PYRGI|nr:uncharacterized protein PgNI_02598 [Pyricularia grisea]TLD16072.1 hypothetical protein PgNI_02598 [Pyricularia grisea]